MKCKNTVLQLVYLAITLCSWNAASAQVWTLNKGEYYLNASLSSLQYDEAFDDAGDIVALPVTVDNKTYQLFAQYGVSPKLTAQVKIPFVQLSSTGDLTAYNSYINQYLETGSLSGIGNAEAGVIYKIVDDKPLVSASLFVETPSDIYNNLTGLRTGFNSWALRPGFGVGWGFDQAWLQYYLGTSLRNNDYSHAVLSSLELGYKPVSYLYAAMVFETRQSFQNGEDCDCTNSETALFLNNQEFISFGLKAGFTLGRVGMNFAYSGAFYGSEVAAAGVPTVGIQFRSN